MARKEHTLAELADAGCRDGGPFQDHLHHLRRLLAGLQGDPLLSTALRAILSAGTEPTLDVLYRLRSAGLLHGGSPRSCRIRCQLYTDYFGCHLRCNAQSVTEG